jgi:hypothetical protein
MKFASDYTHVKAPLAVRENAVVLPDGIVRRAERLAFDKPGVLYSQEAGVASVALWTLRGTVALHVDDVFARGETGVCLGLVVINEPGAMLRGHGSRLPLPPGSVYRLDPSRKHGTCLPNGRRGTTGRFVFVACDMLDDDEQSPVEFAGWILDALATRLDDFDRA